MPLCAGARKIGGVNTMFGAGRHHCRKCQHSFCQACSSNSASISDSQTAEAVRVCDTCATVLTGGIRRPSVSCEGVLRGWLKLKRGHAGMLDQTKWRSRWFELDQHELVMWEKRSSGLLRGVAGRSAEDPTVVIKLDSQLMLSIENRKVSDWVIHVRTVHLDGALDCRRDQCIRLKSDPDMSTQEVVPQLWGRILHNLAALHAEEDSWAAGQQYGLRHGHTSLPPHATLEDGRTTSDGRTEVVMPSGCRTLGEIVQVFHLNTKP